MTRFRPYLVAIAIATLLATVVWIVLPNEYGAITKLSDEYKETDLAVGLNSLPFQIKNQLELDNIGINNIEVYSKWLKTDDFARHIANIPVPGKNMEYGQWLISTRRNRCFGRKDTVSAVKRQIECNLSTRHQTLTIRFSDRDPLVASQMLDSVTVHLQNLVTEARQKYSKALLADAINRRDSAGIMLKKTQQDYIEYADSHRNVVRTEESATLLSLKKDAEAAQLYFQKTAEQCTRLQSLCHRQTFSFTIIRSNTVPVKGEKHNILIFLSFIGFALLLVKGHQRYVSLKESTPFAVDFGNIFSPWTLTVGIWSIVLICIHLLGSRLYPLTSQAYIGILLWVTPFCLCSFITYQLGKKDGQGTAAGFQYSKTVFYILLAISLIMSPLCVKKVVDIISLFGTKDLMSDIRALAVHGEGFGFPGRSFVINEVLLIIILWNSREAGWKLTLIVSLLLCVNCFALMDKGSIFFILSALIFVLYEKNRIKSYHIGLALSITIAVFFGFTILRSGLDDFGNRHLVGMSFLEFLSMYIFANPVAFGYLDQSISPQVGSNVFYLIYYYLSRFGLSNHEVIDITQEFSWVPIATNQYTIMQPFFLDFGYWGIFLFASLYGVVSGWIYNSYRNGDIFGKVAYTYFIHILILQFGQEQVFLAPVSFIRTMVLLYLLTQTRFHFRWKSTPQTIS